MKDPKKPAQAKTQVHKNKKKIKNADLLLDKKILNSDPAYSGQNKKTGSEQKGDKKQDTESEKAVKTKIDSDIEAVKDYLSNVYNVPVNGDILIREFSIMINDTAVAEVSSTACRRK